MRLHLSLGNNFPWQSGPEPPKPESPPPVVTTQPRAQCARPADADDVSSEQEADKHSPDSDAREGSDPRANPHLR